MDTVSLAHVAKALVAPGKGILAADESFGTIEKRFAKIGVPSTEETRRAYREMLFTAPGAGEFISSVIMFDETFRQSTREGASFVSVLESAGILPGIKVDLGTEPAKDSPEEKRTKGLDGLADRLKEYVSLGGVFAKWRAVITISGSELPTRDNIVDNARDLAAYASLCQKAGLVPIVEPEVLMDGSHTIETCEEVSRVTLTEVFRELAKEHVALSGMILKTNMVLPGKENRVASPEEVAERTTQVFKETLPPTLAGQAFLSGGQSEAEATANLNAINALGPHPWPLSFSYGRALQETALTLWAGKDENVAVAQAAFLKRARLNGLATLGQYDAALENA